jgi:hypothetical protein
VDKVNGTGAGEHFSGMYMFWTGRPNRFEVRHYPRKFFISALAINKKKKEEQKKKKENSKEIYIYR